MFLSAACYVQENIFYPKNKKKVKVQITNSLRKKYAIQYTLYIKELLSVLLFCIYFLTFDVFCGYQYLNKNEN